MKLVFFSKLLTVSQISLVKVTITLLFNIFLNTHLLTLYLYIGSELYDNIILVYKYI